METSFSIVPYQDMQAYYQSFELESGEPPIALGITEIFHEILSFLNYSELATCRLVCKEWDISAHYVTKKQLICGGIDRLMKLFVISFVATHMENQYQFYGDEASKPTQSINELLQNLKSFNSNNNNNNASRYRNEKNAVYASEIEYCWSLIQTIDVYFEKDLDLVKILNDLNTLISDIQNSSTDAAKKQIELYEFKKQILIDLKEKKDIVVLFGEVKSFSALEVSEELEIIQEELEKLQLWNKVEFSREDFKINKQLDVSILLNTSLVFLTTLGKMNISLPLMREQTMGGLIGATEGRPIKINFPRGLRNLGHMVFGPSRMEVALLSTDHEVVRNGIAAVANVPLQIAEKWIEFGNLKLDKKRVKANGQYYLRFTFGIANGTVLRVESRPFEAKDPKANSENRVEEITDTSIDDAMEMTDSEDEEGSEMSMSEGEDE